MRGQTYLCEIKNMFLCLFDPLSYRSVCKISFSLFLQSQLRFFSVLQLPCFLSVEANFFNSVKERACQLFVWTTEYLEIWPSACTQQIHFLVLLSLPTSYILVFHLSSNFYISYFFFGIVWSFIVLSKLNPNSIF